MRVTIRDVAKRSGASAMSVSAALNGAGRNVSASAEKAERIGQADREPRCQTNHMARTFRTQRTGQVAVVFQNFGRFFPQSAYRGDVMNGVLARYAKPDAPHTALVCFSDELAGFVLASCERLGVDVPGHASVVGFDSSPLCETTRPRLTSVNQPVERMAFEATAHLLSIVRAAEEGSSPSAATSTLYDCGLDVRESTGPARTH